MCKDCNEACPNKKELSEEELKNIAGAGIPDCLSDYSLPCSLIGKHGSGYDCSRKIECKNPTKCV